MSALTKLMAARLALQAKELKKSGHNKFAGYYYFELGDFLPVIQEIFANLKLCGVVSYTADIAKLTITDTEDNTFVEITSPMGSAALKGCHEVQNVGAVETYQRRYLWVTAMEIVEHDILDATTGKEKPETKADPKITPTGGTWDALSSDEQIWLTDVANEMRALLSKKDIKGALARLDLEQLDADKKVAIWSRFDSKERSAMKKERELQKETATQI